jgi:hypothetical protein
LDVISLQHEIDRAPLHARASRRGRHGFDGLPSRRQPRFAPMESAADINIDAAAAACLMSDERSPDACRQLKSVCGRR